MFRRSKYVVGENIRRYRKEKGWTQYDLAKAMGTSQSTVYLSEHAKRNINCDMVDQFADALGILPVYLFEDWSDGE